MSIEISIPKKSGAASPVPKSPNILLIPVSSLPLDANGNYTFPTRDGVKITGDLTLADGKKAIAMYATPSTIKRMDTSDGNDDAKGFTQKVEFEHPGDSLAANNFVQEIINEDMLIITTECSDSDGARLHGTPCNPLKLVFESQDDNEAKKMSMKFSQSMRSKFKMAHYAGALPAIYPFGGAVTTTTPETGA